MSKIINLPADSNITLDNGNSPQEEFADMFTYWIYNGFDNSPAGEVRQQSMDEWLLGGMIYGGLLTSSENGEPRDSEFIRGIVNQLT